MLTDFIGSVFVVNKIFIVVGAYSVFEFFFWYL